MSGFTSRHQPAGPPCHLGDLLQDGFFVRAFECAAFTAPFNVTIRALSMPGQFEREFDRCALDEFDRRDAPTSFLRHDLPVLAYGNRFGAHTWPFHSPYRPCPPLPTPPQRGPSA